MAEAKITSEGRRALNCKFSNFDLATHSLRTSTEMAMSAVENIFKFLGKCDSPTAITVS